MNMRIPIVIVGSLIFCAVCMAEQKTVSVVDCNQPNLAAPLPAYQAMNVKNQPAGTADLPAVVQTVEQALRCYQALSKEPNPLQPPGLPKISSAVMDFKTTTGKTAGISFSIFVFKIGASRESDVTDDVSFTYSVPQKIAPPPALTLVKPAPPDLFKELINEVTAAASAAQAQSTALGMPLSKVSITIAYGIKFDANASLNAPVSLVTIGGNGDYNKNNTQTLTLTFGQ
jgi:hypothetical protein